MSADRRSTSPSAPRAPSGSAPRAPIVLPGERIPFAVTTRGQAPRLLEADPDVAVTTGAWATVESSRRPGAIRFREPPVSFRTVGCRWRVREVDAVSGTPVLEGDWGAPGMPVERALTGRLGDLRFGHDLWLALGVLRDDGATVLAALVVDVLRDVADRGSVVEVRAARWEGVRRFVLGRTETVEIAADFRDCRSRLLLDLVLTVRPPDVRR